MATIDWQRFFTLPLPEFPGDLVELCPSGGGVPGMTLPRAKAIRKLTILTLWPAVAGDRDPARRDPHRGKRDLGRRDRRVLPGDDGLRHRGELEPQRRRDWCPLSR